MEDGSYFGSRGLAGWEETSELAQQERLVTILESTGVYYIHPKQCHEGEGGFMQNKVFFMDFNAE